MRALGAGRTTVMAIVLLESLMLAVAAGLSAGRPVTRLLGLAQPWMVDPAGSVGQHVPAALLC